MCSQSSLCAFAPLRETIRQFLTQRREGAKDGKAALVGGCSAWPPTLMVFRDRRTQLYDCSSLNSLYSILSTSASQLAVITFSWTPTVPQVLPPSSWLSITTRTAAAVPASELITRTL